MQRLTARAGPVRLAFLVAALAIAALPAPTAVAQPDPAAKLHVESTTVNLSEAPSFNFLVAIPTLLQFTAQERGGQRFLRILAISRIDSLDARITKASSYLSEHPGIFTPLFDPPSRLPSLGYVDRAQFERALRGFRPERRLSYHRRLT